jgi:hypothetical protein
VTDLNRNEAKKIKNKLTKTFSKWPTKKKRVFQPPPKAEQFLPKFGNWSLGD